MWDLPGTGIEPVSPALAGRSFTTDPPGKPWSPRFLIKNRKTDGSVLGLFPSRCIAVQMGGDKSQCFRTEWVFNSSEAWRRGRPNRRNSSLQFLSFGDLVLKVSPDNKHSVLLVVCEMCSLQSAMPQSLRAVKEVRWWMIQIHVGIRIFQEARRDYLIRVCAPAGCAERVAVWMSSSGRGTLLLRGMTFCPRWRVTKAGGCKVGSVCSLCAQNVRTYLFSLLRGILLFMISELSYLPSIYLGVPKEFLL